jgi:hypothetical protein
MTNIPLVILVLAITFFAGAHFKDGVKLNGLIPASPTIVLLPTNPPTSTLTPTKSQTKKAVNTDPIVTCKSASPNCVGQSIEVRESQCSKHSCCQVGNSWIMFASVEKCNEAQSKNKPLQKQTGNTNNNQNRVQYIVTNGLQNGTYYCYPDRVNELTQQDQAIKSWQAALDHCKFQQQPTQDSCIDACNGNSNYSSCIQPCHDSYLSVCKSEIDSLYNSRKELSNKVHEICP